MDDDEDLSHPLPRSRAVGAERQAERTFIDFWFAAEAELKSKQDDSRPAIPAPVPAKEADHSPVDADHAVHRTAGRVRLLAA